MCWIRHNQIYITSKYENYLWPLVWFWSWFANFILDNKRKNEPSNQIVDDDVHRAKKRVKF